MPAVIGLDLGTTAAKAVAYDAEGNVLSRASREYPLLTPFPGAAEQKPERVLGDAIDALSEAVAGCPEPVAGVGLSGAMHTLIGVDTEGKPLTNSLTYADARAAEQAERVPPELHRRTGTPAHPMSPLAKLMWFREQDPDTFQRTARWVSIKEYVVLHLFGEHVVDYSTASATGLLNLEKLDWDAEALELAGIPAGKLSTPVPATRVLLGMDGECARRVSLDPDTPFAVGASDGTLDNLGVGAVEPGVLACSIGTSGAVRAVVGEPAIDEQNGLFCYALAEGMWVVGGPVNNGGIPLRWLRDEVFPDLKERSGEPYDEMIALAAGAPPGSGGLLFLPYLTGERAPHWDSRARGVFFGLSLEHGRGHVIRSVMEGVALQVHAVARRVYELAGSPAEVRATGGFARSPVWRQILTDVFNREFLFSERFESACRGAALVALHAFGEISSLKEEAVRAARVTHRHTPEPGAAKAYKELFPLFERLYERLEPEFEALSRFNLPR